MTSPATPSPAPDPRQRLASVTALPTGTAVAEPGMNSVEACVAANITYRQLDYWARVGYLHAINEDHLGCGSSRRFSDSEVQVARHAKLMVDAGFSTPEALRLARVLIDTGEPIVLAGGLVTISTGPASA